MLITFSNKELTQFKLENGIGWIIETLTLTMAYSFALPIWNSSLNCALIFINDHIDVDIHYQW